MHSLNGYRMIALSTSVDKWGTMYTHFCTQICVVSELNDNFLQLSADSMHIIREDQIPVSDSRHTYLHAYLLKALLKLYADLQIYASYNLNTTNKYVQCSYKYIIYIYNLWNHG